MLRPTRAVANPPFSLSWKLGGADADLILDGCLLDIKVTKAPAMRREVAYQLIGYLLADTNDATHQARWVLPGPGPGSHSPGRWTSCSSRRRAGRSLWPTCESSSCLRFALTSSGATPRRGRRVGGEGGSPRAAWNTAPQR